MYLKNTFKLFRSLNYKKKKMVVKYNDVKYYMFWSGVFSNWHPSPFIIDGIVFNCGEQWMMYQKAITFGDTLSANKILIHENPAKQKEIGRGVVGYNDKKWSEIRFGVVKRGLREKFLQNPDIMAILKKNSDCIFVEASPKDNIWGIGFDKYNALENMDKWGQNLLGKIITELADEFKNGISKV